MTRDDLVAAALAAVEVQNRVYSNSFSRWLFEQVKTQDEASQQLLRFPDKEYLKDLARALETEQMVVIPKSRRVMASWILAAYAHWKVRFHKHTAVFFQSLTESKAAYIVDQRIKLIEDSLEPIFKREYEGLKTKTGLVGKLTFKDTGSFVQAIPQGDDVIRSYTPSLLICDEIDFMPEGHLAVNAAMSTVEKASQIVLITTSNGPSGVVGKICKTANFQKWADHKEAPAVKPYKVLAPIEHPGGWKIFPVHYTHDPEKTGEEWREKAQAMYDRVEGFNAEMELDFTSQLGTAAYPAFNFAVHVRDKIKPSSSLPILLACDFNLDPCVFEICQIRNGLLLVFDEICLGPATIPEMVEEFRNRYPAHHAGIIVYGDSNGLRKNVQSAKSDYDLMKLHFSGYPGKISFRVPRAHPVPRDRINGLNHRFRGVNEKPTVYVSQDCRELIEDLQEVVLRPDGKDVLKVYKHDDPYARRTHASDALGYLVFREFPLAREALALHKGKKVKPLNYGKILGGISG